MLQISPWKIGFIVLVCLFGIFYSAPNVVGSSSREWMQRNLPSWMPNQTVNLGLDLQGGAHLLFSVDINSVMIEQRDNILSSIRGELREERIPYAGMNGIPDGVRVMIKNADDFQKAERVVTQIDDRLTITPYPADNAIEATFNEQAKQELISQTISQSIEVVRRRIDETGTNEPIIQRQGDDRILVQLPGVEDPTRIKELIGTTAKMTFHLVIGDEATGRGGLLLPSADIPGQRMRVDRRPDITGEMLTNAQPTFQLGQPVVSFNLNSVGARRFCKLTQENTGTPFAIVLDNDIISAPRINEPICGGAAIISGDFTVAETSDLALLLRAGALPAELKIIEERTVGPSLGADSIEAGKMASLVGLAFILVFMFAVYGLFGIFANIALVLNISLIFALLSSLQATLTLPGIAGIVLTVGMAVDANVLIFERIKEELRTGRSPISSVDAGYGRAMTTIIDSNLTTLIAAIILFSFGTGPVKGFAVTLGIGIVTSFFSAIMLTRLMVVTWLRNKRPSVISV